MAKTILDDDQEAWYQAIQKLFAKDPRNQVSNYLMGLAASHFNRPHEVVEYYQLLDYTTIPIVHEAHTWWHYIYALNLIRLDRLDEAMDVLNFVPIEKAAPPLFLHKQEIYVRRNQPDSIKQMIADLEERNFSPELIHNLYLETSIEYALLHDRENQQYWANLALENILAQPESASPNQGRLAEAYYFGEQYERALPLYRELANSQPSNPWMFQRLATCYARLGEREEALKLIEQLRDMEQPRSRGRYPYLIGMIYATLDEKEKAMQYLKQAHREGYGFGPGTYQNAFELIPLHGYPPYEAFVAPKG